jgi:uncharacterized protein YkwD
MFKELWNSFVPTEKNDYRPYFLRAWPVAVLLTVIVGLYGGAQWAEQSLTTSGSTLAAVISSVLVDLANADRAENDVGGLAVNPVLEEAAQMKANDMAANGYFAHTSPTGKTPWYWFQQADYKFSYAGENLAVYFTDSADVNQAWMNSPGHRANLLSPHFSEIGIATAQGVYQGQPTTFVVQEFGTPAMERPVPAPFALATSTALVPKAPPKKVATTTPVALVKGAATTSPPAALTIIHEDSQFIAVRSASTTPAPSAYQVTSQSTFGERMLASPKTALSYAYAGLAGVIIIALIFLIVFEIKKQRPMNILYAVLLIALIGLLLYASESHVIVQTAQAAFFGT